MTPDEVRAAGGLGTQVYHATVSHIEKAHTQDRGGGVSAERGGGGARPRHARHHCRDRIRDRPRGWIGGWCSAQRGPPGRGVGTRRPVGSTPRTNLALSALNAAIGDKLADEQNPLAIRMSVRHHRRDLVPTGDTLGAAFPAATPKVAVFLHGLGETDESWRLNSGRDGTT